MLQCSGPGPPCRDAQFGGNGLVIDGVRNHLAVLIKDAIEDAWIYPSGDQGFEINLRLLAEAGSCIPAPTAIEGDFVGLGAPGGIESGCSSAAFGMAAPNQRKLRSQERDTR